MTIPTHQWSRLMAGIVALLLAWTSGCLVVRFETDYRFANDLIEHAQWGLPLLLLSVSVVTRHAARAVRTPGERRWQRRVARCGLLLGGSLTLAELAVAPFVALALAFGGDVAPRGTPLEHLVSPDGGTVADVTYYGPSMAVQSLGTLWVSVTYRVAGLPIIRRDVYAQPLEDVLIHINPQPYRSYVRWQGNDALVIPSAQRVVALTPGHVSVRHL